jgi:protein EFR3
MAPDIPFKEMTSHCEALSIGKHQKMSMLLMSFNHNKQAAIVPKNQSNNTEAVYTPVEQVHTQDNSLSMFSDKKFVN